MRGPCTRAVGRRGFICTLKDFVGEEVVDDHGWMG